MKAKYAISVFLALTIFLAGCTSTKSIAVALPEPAYWPTDTWQASDPEAQGMDSQRLAAMLDDILASQTNIHSILIIRNGYMVAEAYFHPYTGDTKVHIQSVTKSVIGALVGIAVQNGLIKNENETVLSFFPGEVVTNPSPEKSSITLKHLLSMTSGFPCAEFSGSGETMEQSSDWVQYMLNLPVTTTPGETFGYCNGNAHLLSAVIEKSTGIITREYANQTLFPKLGIPAAEASDWLSDPQRISTGGYGLHLRPVDLAKIAFLYLHRGEWAGEQIIPEQWVIDSATQQTQKPEGSGYGYLWTVYPEAGHYAALGMAGQQIHIYPSKNLIVIVTAELESYAEAPEIERMLNEYILPAIKSNSPLQPNPNGDLQLKAAIDLAAEPVKAIPELPAVAQEISGATYKFAENPVGWQSLKLLLEPGASTAQVSINGSELLEIGLDNIYRSSNMPPVCDHCLLRGRWTDGQTFLIDFPAIQENTTTEIQAKFTGQSVEITVQPLIFAAQPVVFSGIQQ